MRKSNDRFAFDLVVFIACPLTGVFMVWGVAGVLIALPFGVWAMRKVD